MTPEPAQSDEPGQPRDAGGEARRANLMLKPEEFHLFRDYIHQHSGIFLDDDKLDSLRISLLARTTRLELETYSAYFDILAADEREFRELMDLVTINETSFFRFPQQFDVLGRRIVPEILAKCTTDTPTVRVWSAGCSTGEEPYSIAIAIDEALTGMGRYARVQVIGTDVSQRALSHARRGEYTTKKMANVPRRVIDRYFDVDGDRCRVGDRVREMVEFKYHNLIKEAAPASMIGTWDVIFCRNVTIYFKVESTQRVVSNFYKVLTDGGYLFIGHSETLHTVSDEFVPVELDGVFLYKKLAEEPKRAFGFLGSMPKIEPKPVAKRRTVLLEGTRRLDEGSSSQATIEMPFPQAEEGPEEQERLDAMRHLRKGFVYADDGRYDDAMAECLEAVRIDPLLAAARYVLGIIHEQRGEETEAVADFKRTVYIDPRFALAHFQLGQVLKGMGDEAGARKSFAAALAAIRQDPGGEWTDFLGGFDADLISQTCERGLKELQKK
jgi:chemotaxis protein methyltransferase CheR